MILPSNDATISDTRNATCKPSNISKSVLDMLGNPKYVTFKVRNGVVTVEAGQKVKGHLND